MPAWVGLRPRLPAASGSCVPDSRPGFACSGPAVSRNWSDLLERLDQLGQGCPRHLQALQLEVTKCPLNLFQALIGLNHRGRAQPLGRHVGANDVNPIELRLLGRSTPLSRAKLRRELVMTRRKCARDQFARNRVAITRGMRSEASIHPSVRLFTSQCGVFDGAQPWCYIGG